MTCFHNNHLCSTLKCMCRPPKWPFSIRNFNQNFVHISYVFSSFSFIFLHLLSALDQKQLGFSSFRLYLLFLSPLCHFLSPRSKYLAQYFLRHFKNYSSLKIRKAEDYTYVKKSKRYYISSFQRKACIFSLKEHKSKLNPLRNLQILWFLFHFLEHY